MKKILFWFIIGFILIRTAVFIFLNQLSFTRPFFPEYSSRLYSQSQYVLGNGSKRAIGDDGVYSYAGYYLVFQKGDVSAVNFEHPPLGKYLIGVSIALFHNENVTNLFYYAGILIFTFLLGKIVFRDQLLAMIPVFFFSMDPLVNNHLTLSLLDLPFTLFFLAGTYFFIRGFTKNKIWFLSFFFWGIAFATKFFPFFVVLYLFFFLCVFVRARRHLIVFVGASLLVPIIYLIAHTTFFFYHPSLIEFLRHKKWMIDWWMGSPIIRGNIIRNIFTGWYYDSVDNLVRNEYWSILLPIVTVLALFRFRKDLYRKNRVILFLYGEMGIYMAYLILFNNGIQKYLMPIYPLMLILALSTILLIIRSIMSSNKVKRTKTL